MSAGHEVNAEHLSAREQAVRWVENHPLRDGIAQSVLFVMCRLINGDDRMIWPSVEFLVWRTGFSRNAIKRVISEFRRHDILHETGEKHGQGGTLIYIVQYELTVDAYPDGLTFDEYKARAKAPHDQRKMAARATNAGPRKASVAGRNGGPREASVAPVEGANGGLLEGQRWPSADATVAFSGVNGGLLEGQRWPSEGHEGLEGLQQGSKAVNKGDLIAGHASALSRTDDDRALTALEDIAKAMIDTFHNVHGEVTAKNDIDGDCRRFVEQGLGIADMRAAIIAAKRQQKDQRKPPKWTAVANALDAVRQTRATVFTAAHSGTCSTATLHAARALETIFMRHLDKPFWSASRSRWDMADWLLQAVAHGVDTGLFEAACHEVKKQANGKPPTWKHVRAALDALIRARERGMPKPVTKAKGFFDLPAVQAGTYAVPGNDTRH